MIMRVLTAILLLRHTECQRRIVDGLKLHAEKKYLVYLKEAEEYEYERSSLYYGWVCGGAIVTPQYIVTSAACVEDVSHLYAIAGYTKYLSAHEIKTNECTNAIKRKIITTCVPKRYTLDYEKTEKWSSADIAVAKVDVPYNFIDDSFQQHHCSYSPTSIKINYEINNQAAGLDAIVMGWGHVKFWRKEGDNAVFNTKYPHYAPVKIQDKNECKKYYADYPSIQFNIDHYMICTLGRGNINDTGHEISTSKPKDVTIVQGHRFYEDYYPYTRRQGICQNDHGGPLVTWVGSREILIGVASVFRLNNSYCEGPFLYTSTQSLGGFLHCVINDNTTRRSSLCDQPPIVRGFDIITRRITWDNPPGNAELTKEKQLLRMRPQIPIQSYG